MLNTFQLVPDGTLWAIRHEAVNFSKPVMSVRMWRPEGDQRVLLADRLMGQAVGGHVGTEADKAAGVERWRLSDPMSPLACITVCTPLHSVITEGEAIPVPRGGKGRVWYWDGGEWRWFQHGASYHNSDLDRCWHRLPGVRALSPPRNPARQ